MKKLGERWRKYKIIFPETTLKWPLKRGEIALITAELNESPLHTEPTPKPKKVTNRTKLYYEAKNLGFTGGFVKHKNKVFSDFIDEVRRPAREVASFLRRNMQESDPFFNIDLTDIFLNRTFNYSDLFDLIQEARGWKRKILIIQINGRWFPVNDRFFQSDDPAARIAAELLRSEDDSDTLGSDETALLIELTKLVNISLIAKNRTNPGKSNPGLFLFEADDFYIANDTEKPHKENEPAKKARIALKRIYQRYIHPDNDGAFLYHELEHLAENPPPRDVQALDCLGNALVARYPKLRERYILTRSLTGGTSFPREKLGDIQKALKVRIRLYIPPNQRKTTRTYQYFGNREETKNFTKSIDLAIIEDHYILFESTPFTTSELTNYLEVNYLRFPETAKEAATSFATAVYKAERRFRENFDDLVKIQKGKPTTSARLNSYDFINFLVSNEIVTPLDSFKLGHLSHLKPSLKIENVKYNSPELGNISPGNRHTRKSMPKKKRGLIVPIYADFESLKDENGKHVIYQLVMSYTIKGEWKEHIINQDDPNLLVNILFEVAHGHMEKHYKSGGYSPYILFHNLGYDSSFIMRFSDKKFKITSRIGKSNLSTITLQTRYKRILFKFQDSYAFITQPLAKFPKTFGLKSREKEIFPYDACTSETIACDAVELSKALEVVKKDKKDVEKFLKQCEEFIFTKTDVNGVETKYLKIRSYSAKYCVIDVEILREGFEKFRTDIRKIVFEVVLGKDILKDTSEFEDFEFDVLHYLTTPSLSYGILELAKLKCRRTEFNAKLVESDGGDPESCGFLDIPEMDAVTSNYIQQTMVGGRCMTRNNKLQDCRNIQLAYDDITSLYPSAFTMEEMDYIPLTYPTKLLVTTPDVVYTSVDKFREDNELNPREWFFVTVEVLKVNNPRNIASLSTKYNETVTGLGSMTNRKWEDKPGMYVLNHIQLEDLCTFQEIEFKVLGGICYRNPSATTSLKDFVQNLFNTRAVYKKAGCSMEQIIKLILNSFYGKMIQKFRPTTEVIRTETPEEFERWLSLNFQTVESYIKIEGYEKVYKNDIIKPSNEIITHRIIKRKESGTYVSKAHVASVMYAVSKRVMNKIIYLLEDAGKSVFYTDTDSLFYPLEDREYLRVKYKQKYGVGLFPEDYTEGREGGNLGLLHPDFDAPNQHPDRSGETSCSSVFFGKKFYTMHMNFIDRSGEQCKYDKMKIKGIPEVAINHLLEEDYINYKKNDTGKILIDKYDATKIRCISDIETKLLEGETIPFDLANSKPCFQSNASFITSTNGDFVRTIKIIE
jgi:hypothetical protein